MSCWYTNPKGKKIAIPCGPINIRPIDQMNNAELKAELKRRLPCCAEKPSGAAS